MCTALCCLLLVSRLFAAAQGELSLRPAGLVVSEGTVVTFLCDTTARTEQWPIFSLTTSPPEVNKTVISKDLPGGVRQQSLTMTATAAYNNTLIVCIVSNGETSMILDQKVAELIVQGEQTI